MPKKIVTDETMPILLNILDRWQGRLTWPMFCKEIALNLNIEKVSRHTLLSYPNIVQEFDRTKARLAESIESEPPVDFTLDWALKEIEVLRNKVSRLEEKNNQLNQRHIRWQRNYYMMKGVDLVKLDECELIDELNRPLPRK